MLMFIPSDFKQVINNDNFWSNVLFIEVCLGFSVLRLFRTLVCLAQMVFMQRQKMNDLLLRACVVRTSKMKIGRLRQKIAPKGVLHVQHDYFSSFNQLNHWFVAFSLPFLSSFLKLPNSQLFKQVEGRNMRSFGGSQPSNLKFCFLSKFPFSNPFIAF